MLSKLDSLFQKPNIGLLLIRVFTGLAMISHGIPKFQGGTSALKQVGGAMGVYGIDFAPVFWGALGATAESLGGLLIVLGLFFRPAALALAFTMLTAVFFNNPKPSIESFSGFELAFVYLCVFLGLFFTGPGSLSAGGVSKGGSSKAKSAPAKKKD